MANILKKLFAFAHGISSRNPWMTNIFLWKKVFQPIWHRMLALTGNIPFANNARTFFKQNAERINKIADFFYDLESKNTFLGAIKFRQTGKRKNIVHYSPYTQYFINDFFTYGKNEVLIDCGAFNGDTIESFLKLPNMGYEQIIAFEPNAENYKILKSKFTGGRGDIMLINAGAYSKDGELYFSGSGVAGIVSEISTGAKDEINIAVKAIDNLPNLRKVTFIKMDIEGAELEALKGARETILRDKPRLAISIYHSNEDMLRIVEWVHALMPEYKLYCRCHNYTPVSDILLYAQIAGNSSV
jgi:FkbM family methyltransferase